MYPLATVTDFPVKSGEAAESTERGSSSSLSRERFYHTVLESLAEGVIITDASDRIFYSNGVATEITGYSAEELLGAKLRDILFAGDPDAPDMPIDCSSECSETEIRSKNGQLGWVCIRRTPYRNELGDIAGTITAMSCIHERKHLEFENEALHAEIRENVGSIVGRSPALMKVISQIRTVAPTEASVLISGESGTGKELVAHAIHELSARKNHALIRVNCASIPKDLFESEFFGHVRGAFTSAVKDRVGRFELAHRGTLFLDEIGEIPLELQSKLLRVLQEGQFERLGDERTRSVDVRIIAATNRDLLAEAKAGRFRLDLYYRLSVFPIDVPPLRERPDDLPVLATHFAKDAARRLGVSAPRLTQFNLRELEAYDWPGNVRELQNVIERAVILSRSGRLSFSLPQPSRPAPEPCPSLALTTEEASTRLSLEELETRKREIIATALERCQWKIYGANGAAALLNLRPTTLVSMMKRLNLKRPG
jgi:PAS domain S-box-containing protein